MMKLCGGCQKQFEDVEDLREHRREAHPCRFSGAGYCAFCYSGYDSIFDFFDHLIEAHPQQWNKMAEKMDQVSGIELQDLYDRIPLAEPAYRSTRAESQATNLEIIFDEIKQRLIKVIGIWEEKQKEDELKKQRSNSENSDSRKRGRTGVFSTSIRKEAEPAQKKPYEEITLLTPVSQSPCTSHNSPVSASTTASVKIEEEEEPIESDLFFVPPEMAYFKYEDFDQPGETTAEAPNTSSSASPAPMSQLQALLAEKASISNHKQPLSNLCLDDEDAAYFRGLSDTSKCTRCDVRCDSKVTKRYHFLQCHYDVYFNKVRIGDTNQQLTELTRFIGTKLGQKNEAPRVCHFCPIYPLPKGRSKLMIHLKRKHREEFESFREEYFRLADGFSSETAPDEFIHAILTARPIVAATSFQ